MDDKTRFKITEYALKLTDQTIKPEEFEELNSLLSGDPQAARHYNCLMAAVYSFQEQGKEITSDGARENIVKDAFWQEMSEHEMKAARVETGAEPPVQELIQKVVYPQKVKSRVSRFSVYSFAASAAAVFIILFLRYAPQRAPSAEVATLVDQMNAQWAQSSVVLRNGDRLKTNQAPMYLNTGLVAIQYDEGVEVVIEAPAAFEIERSGVFLRYGRLYSRVSDSGLGFRVETPTSQFIDMGTEFGVKSDVDGSSELHVIKGKVQLFAASGDNSKIAQMVTQDSAVRYNAATWEFRDIPVQKCMFSRHFDSKTKTVWRGQTRIDLADIVGGGNGFGGGIRNAGINVVSGQTMLHLTNSALLPGSEGYKSVPSSAYIDGVFSPGIGDGLTQIASDAACRVQFPKTSGVYWGYLLNGTLHKSQSVSEHPLQLKGVVYGGPDNPAITMHSNQGITFDLAAIRENVPVGSITKFRAIVGISGTVSQYMPAATKFDYLSAEAIQSGVPFPSIEFWGFIDGRKICAEKISEAVELEIPITSGDRFLTLAVTESDDSVAYDWALLGRPELVIEGAD